ncbi:MAG TPA: hypothetical protein VJQ59_16870 [Candidatus Sulfotelmatobacter sp.]|nr:hypothetical protein [Candidatus Sulfotelmatobacter sp.]
MSELKQGQKVSIFFGDQIVGISSVARISNRKITLSNGSVWKHATAGTYRHWGSGTVDWGQSRMRACEEGDAEAVARLAKLRKIERFSTWKLLTLEELQTVASICNKYEKDGL